MCLDHTYCTSGTLKEPLGCWLLSLKRALRSSFIHNIWKYSYGIRILFFILRFPVSLHFSTFCTFCSCIYFLQWIHLSTSVYRIYCKLRFPTLVCLGYFGNFDSFIYWKLNFVFYLIHSYTGMVFCVLALVLYFDIVFCFPNMYLKHGILCFTTVLFHIMFVVILPCISQLYFVVSQRVQYFY